MLASVSDFDDSPCWMWWSANRDKTKTENNGNLTCARFAALGIKGVSFSRFDWCISGMATLAFTLIHWYWVFALLSIRHIYSRDTSFGSGILRLMIFILIRSPLLDTDITLFYTQITLFLITFVVNESSVLNNQKAKKYTWSCLKWIKFIKFLQTMTGNLFLVSEVIIIKQARPYDNSLYRTLGVLPSNLNSEMHLRETEIIKLFSHHCVIKVEINPFVNLLAAWRKSFL